MENQLDPDALNAIHQNESLSKSLKKLLPKNGLVFDIGANKGEFLSDLVSIENSLNVYCFEPLSEPYEDLLKVKEGKSNVICKKIAISSKSQLVDFHVTKSDVGSSILKPREGQSSQWLSLERVEKVHAIRLDEFISEQKILQKHRSIDLLKIDAQGYDLEVLRSAGEYLNSNLIKNILLEVNFRNFYYGQSDFIDILKELANANYRLGWLFQHCAFDSFLWWADALFLPKLEE